jgi:bacterioferritin (cytochrome b1)
MAKRDRNYLLLARKLRERAEEALTIVNTYRDPETRRMMLEIAERYEKLAALLETRLTESGGISCETQSG